MLKLVLLVLSLESVAGEDTYTCDAGDLRYLMARVITIRKETDNQIKNLKTTLTTNLDETNRYIDQLNSTLGAIEDQLNNITKIIETDECASNPCSNNATCLDGINRYSCKCGPGYNGTQCQMNIDECASSPCLNGATCNDQVNGYMCTCTSDWTGTHCDQYINVNDCIDIRRNGFKSTGVYKVTLRNTRSVIQVFCDMSTDNGGWTVFQNRLNGSVDFYQNFFTYERGFGDLNGEFWLGLKYIQEMTTGSRTELRIDLTAADGSTAYEVFKNFYLTAGPNYTLFIDLGTGTAGDSQGLSYNKGYAFTTYDRDVDARGDNCAVEDHGGWWYANCAFANLNGEYSVPGTVNAVVSESTIYRRMLCYGLRKYNFTDVSDEQLTETVMKLAKLFPNCGEKMLGELLRQQNIHVPRSRLRDVLQKHDKNGIRYRTRRRLHRRVYQVKGPNHVWHLDTNHKLIRWNIIIAAGVDGFSRMIMYIEALRS